MATASQPRERRGDDLRRRSSSSAPSRDELTPRRRRFEDLDVDSLDLVELAQIVEDEYGVELKGDDIKDVKTVGDVIDLVVARGRHDAAASSSPGVGAVTPLGVGAATPASSAGAPASPGSRTASAAAASSTRRPPLEEGGAPLRPLHAARDRRRRRGDRAGRLGRRAALRRRPDRLRDRHRDRRPRLARGASTTMLLEQRRRRRSRRWRCR